MSIYWCVGQFLLKILVNGRTNGDLIPSRGETIRFVRHDAKRYDTRHDTLRYEARSMVGRYSTVICAVCCERCDRNRTVRCYKVRQQQSGKIGSGAVFTVW